MCVDETLYVSTTVIVPDLFRRGRLKTDRRICIISRSRTQKGKAC
ncbi:hypothetical protein F383_13137 [Gossypium arboreum]|uniref:Uncharacterized protein n=1 Tax=Gossypium arboreum TaxID=29729 RepID=A0A0B0NAB4_GOSAR|nr:hypothetical protein F383_13137 [Gossypium arboreum]